MILAPLLACLSMAAAERPNVVVIQVDDMGFSDLGCYGSEIPTPNLDRLAAGGVRFTQYYSNAKCEPTRNSLMTGGYPFARGKPGVVMAAAMQQAGYRTAIVGKVHGHITTGFQHRYVMPQGAASFWETPLDIDGEQIANAGERFPGFYSTDAFSDEAARWIGAGGAGPFFIYLAYNAPHYPLHAPAADIARFRGAYRQGWDAVRAARFARQQELGLWEPALRLAPREEAVPAWASLTPAQQDAEDLRMAVYAAMIARMDAGVGRVLAAIDAAGATAQTLVLFISDNGACHQDAKPKGPEPGPPGSWHYQGQGWAWASNTPFRKWKTWNHEGGISDPLIVSWPGRIAPGWDRRIAHVTDVTATCLDAAGVPQEGILGLSLLPGPQRRIHDELCWAVLKAKGVRIGDLKAVTRGDDPWELYDLAADRTELRNLAAERPQDLARLVARWNAWVPTVDVIGNERY
jgi:arylsulfatase